MTASTSTSWQTIRAWQQAAMLARIERRRINQDKFILALIILERYLTRFFSEKVDLLPDWTNFLDIPMLVLFVGYVAFATRNRERPKEGTGFGLLALLFLLMTSVSALLNLQRLHPGALGLFVIGFLEPLLFMGLAYLLQPNREVAGFLLKLLWLVGWLQIVVVSTMDLPQFWATRNPDFISGTFGYNAYQLVFLLLAWNVLILSRPATSRYKGLHFMGALLLQVLIVFIMLLAQFRAIIPFAVLTWGLAYIVVNRKAQGMVLKAVMGMSLFWVLLLAINNTFPELKYGDVLQITSRTDEVIAAGKTQAVLNLGELVIEQPQVLLTGTGPGTFATRGFQTFSIIGERETANQIYRRLFSSEPYVTDVSLRYVFPVMGRFAFGAATTASPWFTFLGLPVELGLPGLFLVLLMYFKAIRICWQRGTGQDRVAILARWVLVAMVLTLQMGFLGNWLEVSRLTVPIWTVFGVVLALANRYEEQPTD